MEVTMLTDGNEPITIIDGEVAISQLLDSRLDTILGDYYSRNVGGLQEYDEEEICHFSDYVRDCVVEEIEQYEDLDALIIRTIHSALAE